MTHHEAEDFSEVVWERNEEVAEDGNRVCKSVVRRGLGAYHRQSG